MFHAGKIRHSTVKWDQHSILAEHSLLLLVSNSVLKILHNKSLFNKSKLHQQQTWCSHLKDTSFLWTKEFCNIVIDEPLPFSPPTSLQDNAGIAGAVSHLLTNSALWPYSTSFSSLSALLVVHKSQSKSMHPPWNKYSTVNDSAPRQSVLDLFLQIGGGLPVLPLSGLSHSHIDALQPLLGVFLVFSFQHIRLAVCEDLKGSW